jgi:hypothetical protein
MASSSSSSSSSSAGAAPATLELLPDAVLEHVCSFLAPAAIERVGQTCTQMRAALSNDQLWRRLCTRAWAPGWLAPRDGWLR